MSDLLDTALIQLNSVGLQKSDPKLYQFLKSLLGATVQVRDSVSNLDISISGGGGGGGVTNATYLTSTDETATLVNSRELLAGTNITFDDTVAGERTVNGAASSPDYVVMSDGVQPPTPVDNGAGQFVYVVYTP